MGQATDFPLAASLLRGAHALCAVLSFEEREQLNKSAEIGEALRNRLAEWHRLALSSLTPDVAALTSPLFRLTCRVRLRVQKREGLDGLASLIILIAQTAEEAFLQQSLPPAADWSEVDFPGVELPSELVKRWEECRLEWPEAAEVVGFLCDGGRSRLHFSTLSINPLGGDHPMPVDPEELAAVLAAAERWGSRYPDLWEQGGERGRGFVRSVTELGSSLARECRRRRWRPNSYGFVNFLQRLACLLPQFLHFFATSSKSWCGGFPRVLKRGKILGAWV